MANEVEPKQDPRFRAATVALSDIQRSIRFLHLYPHEHPFCTKALDDVVTHLEAFFGAYGALEIEVRRDGIALDDVVVLKDQSQSTDLSALLHPEGVRSIAIQPAVTRQEIVDLVEILAARYAEHESKEPGGGVDLMTALWRRDFQHIACHVQDDLAPSSVNNQRDEALSPIAKRIVLLTGAIARGYDERHSLETGSFLQRREEFRRKGMLDQDGGANLGAIPDPPPEFHLTELATSRARLVLEAVDPTRGALLDRVSKLVLWAVRRKEGAPATADVARFASGAALQLVAQGEVRRATDLLVGLVKGHPERDLFAGAVSENLARDRSLAVLSQALEKHAAKHGPESAVALATSYLALLHAGAIRSVCAFYGAIDREDARRSFRPFLVVRAKDSPDAIAELTHHKSRAVALEGFTLLAQVGKETRAWTLLEQATRETANAQRASAAQEAYDAATGVKQRRELMTVIENGPDKAQRIAAAQKLTIEVAGPKAFDELSALVQTSAFGKRDEDEVEAVLAAFTRIGRVRAVRILTELATRKTSLFSRKGTRGISQIAQEQLAALKSQSSPGTRESQRLPNMAGVMGAPAANGGSPSGATPSGGTKVPSSLLSATPSGGTQIPSGLSASDPATEKRLGELVKKLAENPDRVNRGNALRDLLALKAPGTFEALCRIALAPDFCLREQDEIIQHLAAIGDLGKLKANKVLSELAGRKVGLLRRSETQRLVTLAQEALAGLKGW